MNAIIADAAFVPRSPLLAVSIQSPCSALAGVLGHEGADNARNSDAFSAVQDERLFVLNLSSGASWNGWRLPPLSTSLYQLVSRPIFPFPNGPPGAADENE